MVWFFNLIRDAFCLVKFGVFKQLTNDILIVSMKDKEGRTMANKKQSAEEIVSRNLYTHNRKGRNKYFLLLLELFLLLFLFFDTIM